MAPVRFLALAPVVALLALAPAAPGAVIPVTTTVDTPVVATDDGLCTLREALVTARADLPFAGCPAGAPGLDTITLGPGVFAISLDGALEDGNETGDLDVGGGPVRITGAGAGSTAIEVRTGDRAFDLLPLGALTLEDLTVRNGNVPRSLTGAGGQGGAVRNQGALALTRVVMDGNAAGEGAGAPGGGGGAVWSGFRAAATVTVIDSTFDGNRAGSASQGGGDGGDGGAIRIEAGTLAVSGSTFVDNAAGEGSGSSGQFGGRGGSGGAIAVGPGTATVINSTFASNRGGAGGSGRLGFNPDGGDGGAIWVSSGSALVEYSTFLGNLHGASSIGANGIVGAIVGGSILADPELRCGGITAHLPNVAPTVDASCAGPPLVGPHALGLLAANGGPTPTLAPGAGSVAIDALAGMSCPATDQRGLPRPQGGGCDAGAVEVQSGPGAPAGLGAGGAGLPAPRTLTRLRIGPAAFRAAGEKPLGTAVSFRLNTAATVVITVRRLAAGKRSKGRCVAPARRLRTARHCTRPVTLRGKLTRQGTVGLNLIRFSGRLRDHALAPGRYTLVVTLPRRGAAPPVVATRRFRVLP